MVGLGEAIVSGLVPGSALSSVAKKDALDNPRVRCSESACCLSSIKVSVPQEERSLVPRGHMCKLRPAYL